MQNSIISIISLFLTITAFNKAFAQVTPQLECESIDGQVKISIYGPLGYFYEDDIDSTTIMEFTNRVIVKTEGRSLEFPNSISVSNDFNDYIIQSFAFNSDTRQFENTMSLYFESESGELSDLTLKIPDLILETQAHCLIRQ